MNNKFGAVDNRVLVGLLIAAAIAIGIAAVIMLDPTGKGGNRLSSDYSYDISELLKIDPELIGYEESQLSIDTGFKLAKAIAVGAEGLVYVAGDKALRVFDGGDVKLEIDLQRAPTCVAVDGDTIYVGTGDHIELYDHAGKQIGKWECLGERAVLTSIAVSKGNIFVADAGNRIVYRYGEDGEIINRIGAKDENRNIPGFLIPSPYFDLAMADDGLLRVVNPGKHRIEAYTFDGDLEFYWGSYSNTQLEGFCGCCNPINFAILSNGNFVTCEKGIVRVKEYDSEGKFIGVVAGPAQLNTIDGAKICNVPSDCQKGGFDVAVDNQSRVLVLDVVNSTVRTFTKNE
jgi:hypothetical protein